MFDKDIAIGIDFGTTNSCIGAFRNDVVEIIPNQINGRTTPSIVSFFGKQISIGEQTQNKNQLIVDPEKTIYSVKRLIGKKSNEHDYNRIIKDLPYKNNIIINENKRPLICVDFNGKKEKYFPEEIAAMIFRHLKENAEKYLKKPIKKAVITIPAYFTETQREATKMAAESVGFEILKIINEPTAAALAFGLGIKDDLEIMDEMDKSFFQLKKNKNEKYCDELKENEEKKILVFDLGGGTLDVTCLKIKKIDDETEFVVLGHSGNTIIGGDDFDNALVNYCIKKFNKENGIFIDPSSHEGRIAQKRLKSQCELAKRFLSNEYKTNIKINSLYNGIDFDISIKRATFEELCKELFDKMEEPIQEALRVSESTNKYDIEEVLLVGGSTRMPKIEEIIKKFFGNKIKIQKNLNPDEIVAYGATLQAAKIMNCTTLENVYINDICSHSLGIAIKGEVFDYKFSRIIKNGEDIPTSSEQNYTTAYDYQSSVLIQIFEGENSLCKNNRFLGSFNIENITLAKKGVPKIKVKILIDQDGIINVSAEETISGSRNSLVIKDDKGIMSEEEKKRMKQKLSKKEDFEKLSFDFDEKENHLIESIKNLKKEFIETNSLKTINEIIEKQEQLINICLNAVNKNNIEKLYKNIKNLFYLYEYILANYLQRNKNKSKQYLQKIEKYMNLFKSYGTNYIKSLLMIFKDVTDSKRISEIVYICIKIFQDIINSESYNKTALYYTNEILELIEIFKNSIYSSSLKSKFEQIEKECQLKKLISIPISTEENIKVNTEDDYLNKLYESFSLEQALFAMDQNTYTIENLGTKTNSKYEQGIRALLLTKLITLQLLFLKRPNLLKLYKMIKEAIECIKSAGLKPYNNKWINTLYINKTKIEKLEKENKQKGKQKGKKKIEEWQTDIKGDNDEENKKFLEHIQNNYFNDKFNEKLKGKTVRDLYDSNDENDKSKLKRCMSMAIDNCSREEPEKKSIFGRFKMFINNIFKKFKLK